MSLDYAILGFLKYQPLSGYDLKKQFDASVRHFWSADQSQIYRTLARLTGQGWVKMEVIEQSEHPDRKVYHITSAGRAELHAWLLGPMAVWEGRSAPLVHLFFAGELSDEELLKKAQELAQQFREMLEIYRQISASGMQDQQAIVTGQPREAYCWMLTLESGFQFAQSQLDWIESVIRRIEAKEIPPLLVNDKEMP